MREAHFLITYQTMASIIGSALRLAIYLAGTAFFVTHIFVARLTVWPFSSSAVCLLVLCRRSLGLSVLRRPANRLGGLELQNSARAFTRSIAWAKSEGWLGFACPAYGSAEFPVWRWHRLAPVPGMSVRFGYKIQALRRQRPNIAFNGTAFGSPLTPALDLNNQLAMFCMREAHFLFAQRTMAVVMGFTVRLAIYLGRAAFLAGHIRVAFFTGWRFSFSVLGHLALRLCSLGLSVLWRPANRLGGLGLHKSARAFTAKALCQNQELGLGLFALPSAALGFEFGAGTGSRPCREFRFASATKYKRFTAKGLTFRSTGLPSAAR